MFRFRNIKTGILFVFLVFLLFSCGGVVDHTPQFVRMASEADLLKDVAIIGEHGSEESKFTTFIREADGTLKYDNKIYSDISEVPKSQKNNILFEGRLTAEDAAKLDSKGVRFVYDKSTYLKQSDRHYEVIVTISQNIEDVQKLYQLDASNAKKLIQKVSPVFDDPSITTVSTYEEMIQKQNEVLAKNEIPVLVYHNSDDVAQNIRSQIDSKTNILTCNSFNNPSSNITSTGLVDAVALFRSLEHGIQNEKLGSFYEDLIENYNSYVQKYKKKRILVWVSASVGTGAAVGGGVYLTCYYTDDNK